MAWILGGLSAALTAAVGFGVQVPVVGNGRAAYALLLVMGMALCKYGIRPDLYSWTHPFTIVGIVVGVAALMLSALYLFGVKLPLITSDRIAILALAGIMALKVVVAMVRGAAA